VNAQSEFTVPALRGSQNTTLVLAVNEQGMPCCCEQHAVRKPTPQPNFRPASTARAARLVRSGDSLAAARYADQAEALVEKNASLKTLQTTIEQAIRSDPLIRSPKTHPQVYEQASRITRAVLDQLDKEQSLGSEEGPTRVLASLEQDWSRDVEQDETYAAAGECSKQDLRYIHVDDDRGRTEPK